MTGEKTGSEKKKSKFVDKEVWDKGKMKGRFMKCGRCNHQAQDWKSLSRTKTSPCLSNANWEAEIEEWYWIKSCISCTLLQRRRLLPDVVRTVSRTGQPYLCYKP